MILHTDRNGITKVVNTMFCLQNTARLPLGCPAQLDKQHPIAGPIEQYDLVGLVVQI